MKWFGSSEKKESENYEKQYLSRYKKQQKPKQKKNTSKNKKAVEIKSDEENQIQPKSFFYTLYLVILGVRRGPKLGPLIEDIGIKEVANIINDSVKRFQKEIDKGKQDDL